MENTDRILIAVCSFFIITLSVLAIIIWQELRVEKQIANRARANRLTDEA